MSANFRTLVAYFLFSITLITIGASFGALALASRVRSGSWGLPSRSDLVWLGDLLHDSDDEPSRVVYLNPAKITIIGDDDDSHANRSSIVPAGQRAVLPGYTGSDRAWKQIVHCVQDRFVDFDVAITEHRPVDRGYTMVAVGGRPSDLGIQRERVSGLSPFNGAPIADSVVFAFSETHSNRVRDTCETIAHELGHTYGLDHSYECEDLMTHLTGCRAKRFVDASVPCGEQSQRPCHDDRPTQSSYGTLMAILGPRHDAGLP